MSAQKAVSKVPTLDRKTTNMQSTYFHNPAGHQYSSVLVWRLHDTPLHAVTWHFFVEAFIIISQVISHCMCSMYHVLTCSGMYVMFVCTSRHPPSDTGATKCIHITLTALELFLLHQESNHCTVANKCH